MSTSDGLLALRLLAALALGVLTVRFALYIALLEPSARSGAQQRARRAVAERAPGRVWLLDLVTRLSAPLGDLWGASAGPLGRILTRAGFPLGFGPAEWAVLSLGSAALAALAASLLALALPWALGCVALASLLPGLRLLGLARERVGRFERELPQAIDLTVLTMAAGADLIAGLTQALAELPAHGPCRDELSCALDALRLGQRRVDCFRELAERVGSERLSSLVYAITRAEEKGTPLVDALRVQAEDLRRARSADAEEEAARAAVRLMFPLLLMLMSLLVLIFSPLLLSTTL